MNKKGMTHSFLLGAIIFVILLLVSGYFVKVWGIDKAKEVSELTSCTNLPVGEGVCVADNQTCTDDDGIVVSDGGCIEEGKTICCRKILSN